MSFQTFRHYFWTTGEPWNGIRRWIVPHALQVLHAGLMCTLRISTSGLAHAAAYLDYPRARGVLLVTWHDCTFLPLHLLRRKNIGVMMSRSRAGQMQAAFWRLHGWPTVWGSTKKREGVQAVREAVRLLRTGQSMAFTPDGPKGPRHHAYPGVVWMASNAPASVIATGVAASAAWHLPTWDRYLIPKPFARVHIHFSEELHVPANLPRADMEDWRLKLQNALNEANKIAAQELSKRGG